MRKISFILLLMLPGAAAFAQQYASKVTVAGPIPAGVVRDEKAIAHLTAISPIASGATARYVAGQSITLQPGFVAQAGSVFQATIGPVSPTSPEPGTTLSVKAFPNPFVTTTTIEYHLPDALRVRHSLTDATGRPVRPLDNPQNESAGTHQTTLDLGHLPTGVYLYQVEANGQRNVLRLLKQ